MLRKRGSWKRPRPHSGVRRPIARTTALLALLRATGLIDKVFPAADQNRIRELTHDHWPARAVADELRMIKLAEAEAAT